MWLKKRLASILRKLSGAKRAGKGDVPNWRTPVLGKEGELEPDANIQFFSKVFKHSINPYLSCGGAGAVKRDRLRWSGIMVC